MKTLPAGLEGSALEIYRNNNDVRVLMNGNRMDYLELPSMLREPFQAELIADNEAREFIQNEFKITDSDALEEKFVGCRYGALNHIPDLIGRKINADAPSCEHVDTCPGLGIVCKIPKGKCGQITRQEYRIIRKVAVGKLDKEIAATLDIEISTVRTFLSRIREKLCVNNRIEIAVWALNNGVV